jgi:hypothetical protein
MEYSSNGLSAERIGRITASQVWKLFDETEREKYIHELVVQRLTGVASPEEYNYAFRWGHHHEPEALRMVADLMHDEVEPVGFIKPDAPLLSMWFGATPDGRLVSAKKYVEVKCLSKTTVLKFAFDGKIPEKHIWQIEAGMLAADTHVWIYAMYNPAVDPIDALVKEVETERREQLLNALHKAIADIRKELDCWR